MRTHRMKEYLRLLIQGGGGVRPVRVAKMIRLHRWHIAVVGIGALAAAFVAGPHLLRLALATGLACSPSAGSVAVQLADPWLVVLSDRSWFAKYVVGEPFRPDTVYAFRVEGSLAPRVLGWMTVSDLAEQDRRGLLEGIRCGFVDVRVGRLARICTTAPAKLFVDDKSGVGIVVEDEEDLNAIVTLKRIDNRAHSCST